MKTRDGVLVIATVAGMAVTARLGVWQLDRADQKLALQADLDRRGALPALTAALAAGGSAVAALRHPALPAAAPGLVLRARLAVGRRLVTAAAAGGRGTG